MERHQAASYEDENGDEIDSAEHGPFRTLVVIEFSTKTPPTTIAWLRDKLTARRNQGGGELLVKTARDEHDEETVFHISATIERLLLAAELMEMKKPYVDKSLREVSMADLENFQNTEDLENFLTLAEKQRIILHELESIRAEEGEDFVPGKPAVSLYRGEAIIPKVQSENLLDKLFPLHDKEELKRLGTEWYQKPFSPQPIAKIQKYFGETVAIYFAFLGFYTMALIPPAFIGTIALFMEKSVNFQVFFSLFNLVWATVFLEVWKRNCSTLAYSWGTINSEQFEEARPQFYGELEINHVTGRKEPSYPSWKRLTKFYCVSVPVVLFGLFLAFLVMLLYFWLQDMADRVHAKFDNYGSLMVTLLPSLVYAIIIGIMNAIYRKVAEALNDWENHRLQSEWENHFITKLVLFDFANCFMSLFYVAFYMQDMTLLRSHLATLLIAQQVIGQVREALLPYLMYKKRKMSLQRKLEDQCENNVGVEPLGQEIPDKLQAQIEASKDEYDGTLDDYLEMFLQFGYVFLFSSVFPLAAFWALLNNITEIRTDAFKLCKIFQRPFAQPTEGIGAWQVAFEAMSVIAVITNCALIGLSPQVAENRKIYGDITVLIIFVLAEHLILFIKVMIAFLVPDAPEWVETALARTEYMQKKAWRKERSIHARNVLRQRSKLSSDARLPSAQEIIGSTEEDATPLIMPGGGIGDIGVAPLEYIDKEIRAVSESSPSHVGVPVIS